MTYETYRSIFMIAAILCGIMFVVSVVLFFVLDVPKLIGDLSGTTAKKAIQNIREKNENTGDKTNRASNVNRGRSKLTDKISMSGKIYPSQQVPLSTGVVTSKIATQNLMPAAEETSVLEPQYVSETTVLESQHTMETTVLTVQGETSRLNGATAGETTLLIDEPNEEVAFEIEFDITFVHSNEIVRT